MASSAQRPHIEGTAVVVVVPVEVVGSAAVLAGGSEGDDVSGGSSGEVLRSVPFVSLAVAWSASLAVDSGIPSGGVGTGLGAVSVSGESNRVAASDTGV
jgi:hypothetical protein